MPGSFSTSREFGFTLIELMIVVIVVAVLLTVAGPSFLDTITRNNVRTQTSRVVASLNLARSTAVERNHPVTICASANSTSQSVPTCGGSLKDGWVIFLDQNEDGTPAAGEILKGLEGLPSNYIIKNGVTPITFYPDGSASTSTGANPIYFCPPDKDERKSWSIELEATGRPHMNGPGASPAGICA
jgi:type IV fimbrial biogenesis protein FimT